MCSHSGEPVKDDAATSARFFARSPRSPEDDVRVHRGVLQSPEASLGDRLCQPRRVRGQPELTIRAAPTVRGEGQSALAQPSASFGGVFLHEDLPMMAAAYLFHIVLNHPFEDGNKRAGTHAAITFLAMNGYELDIPVDEAEQLVL